MALVGHDAVLVGDAAGLSAPRSGEGIRTAVESGLLAAAAIRDRLERGASLQRYAPAVTGRFGARGLPLVAASSVVPEPLRARVGGLVLRAPWFARRVVLDRWFLASGMPPLPRA